MKGKITLGKYSSNYELENPIHFQLEDDKSGVNFLNITMSLIDFASMITGSGYIDCDFELKNADLVGKTREHKRENVFIRDAWNPTEEDKTEALKPFEVDGWVGSRYDLENHHNMVHGKNNTFVVGFHRFVDE
jgi:hypothetical protein